MYQIKAKTPKGIVQIHPCVKDYEEAVATALIISAVKQQIGTIIGDCWVEKLEKSA